jgi:DnaJ-class molecular chaperone
MHRMICERCDGQGAIYVNHFDGGDSNNECVCYHCSGRGYIFLPVVKERDINMYNDIGI